MLGTALRDRLTAPEFRPFTLVLASGEQIPVKHRDSLTIPSIEVAGRRVFMGYVIVLETKQNEVVDHHISLPLIAKLVDSISLNGH